jgi:hypothetical protein
MLVDEQGSQRAKDARKMLGTAGWKILALEREIRGRRIEEGRA